MFEFPTEADPLPRGIVVKNPLEEEHHIISLCFRKETFRFLVGIFTVPRYVSDLIMWPIHVRKSLLEPSNRNLVDIILGGIRMVLFHYPNLSWLIKPFLVMFS